MKNRFDVREYINNLTNTIQDIDKKKFSEIAQALLKTWQEDRQVFICGNGGSAANAIHMANDLFYGIAKESGKGIRVHALPANQSILTCLANDESYADIFSSQLSVLGQPGDILIVLSGSGNSPNVVKVIQKAKQMGIKAFAILGYSGGKCLDVADIAIHTAIDDMQIAEDCQQIIGHMLMRWLSDHNPHKDQGR